MNLYKTTVKKFPKKIFGNTSDYILLRVALQAEFRFDTFLYRSYRHGRRQRRGARGTLAPLEFENDDVICCLQAKFTKLYLSPPSLAVTGLKFSTEHRKFSKNHFFAFDAQKREDSFSNHTHASCKLHVQLSA